LALLERAFRLREGALLAELRLRDRLSRHTLIEEGAGEHFAAGVAGAFLLGQASFECAPLFLDLSQAFRDRFAWHLLVPEAWPFIAPYQLRTAKLLRLNHSLPPIAQSEKHLPKPSASRPEGRTYDLPGKSARGMA
jgi:hypothetical protein